MKNYHLHTTCEDFCYNKAFNDSLNKSIHFWKEHPFFAPESVILGIDMGMEGIGITIRKGKNILYSKTLLVDIPEAKPLAKRRSFRASRHAKKNYRVRMKRLQELFLKHGLPWVSDEIMSRSDPFELRYRAITANKKLASKEALSICIRSIVARRGYDYYALCSSTQDSYPWGDDLEVNGIKNWLKTSYIDDKIIEIINNIRPEIVTAAGKALNESQLQGFDEVLEKAKLHSKNFSLNKMLERYAKYRDIHNQKGLNRKMRGMNYPRQLLIEHLNQIIDKHSHLIDDVEGMKNDLFSPCETKKQKAIAIMRYNRKTPLENQRIYERKIKYCPYTTLYAIPPTRCDLNSDNYIRRYKLLMFLVQRRFYVTQIKSNSTHLEVLDGPLIEDILNLCTPLKQKAPDTSKIGMRTIKNLINEYLKNKGKKLYNGKNSASQAEWNKAQNADLKDLCVPSAASLKKRAKMCSKSARRMLEDVTTGHTCYHPEYVANRFNESGIDNIRRNLDIHIGAYPQISQLLGDLNFKNGTYQVSSVGLLQRLFTEELADQLGGKTFPDFVVIETIREAARNQLMATKIRDRQKANQARNQKLAKAYDLKEAKGNAMRRIHLWEEQGGSPTTPAHCPFTGKELPMKNNQPDFEQLELAHLYPDSLGGFSINENLVLTTRHVNASMDNKTPCQAAEAGIFGITKEHMINLSKKFRWNAKKRELFSFEITDTCLFPDFGNMTRMGQLSTQLRNRIAFWIGILDNKEALRERIGTPSGLITNLLWQAFISDTQEGKKDRNNHLHHRVDAALLTFIPPTGLNDIRYKGCFYSRPKRINGEKTDRRKKCIFSESAFILPDVKSLLGQSANDCPVIRKKPNTANASLGDSTFWHVQPDGTVWQRVPLESWLSSTKKAPTPEMVIKALQGYHTPYSPHYPSKGAIEKWLLANTPSSNNAEEFTYKPLKDNNGHIIKRVWKKGEKNSMVKSPIGWSGKKNLAGNYEQMMILSNINEAMQIWIGYDQKKKTWVYQIRIVESKQAKYALKRLGINSQNEAINSKKLIDHSILIKEIRKYDVFFINNDKGLNEWCSVSSIVTAGNIKVKSLINKKDPVTLGLKNIPDILGLDPNDYALKHNLKPSQL